MAKEAELLPGGLVHSHLAGGRKQELSGPGHGLRAGTGWSPAAAGGSEVCSPQWVFCVLLSKGILVAPSGC